MRHPGKLSFRIAQQDERKFIRDPVAIPDRTALAEVGNWVPDQFSFFRWRGRRENFPG
jgi:hypothetical protein